MTQTQTRAKDIITKLIGSGQVDKALRFIDGEIADLEVSELSEKDLLRLAGQGYTQSGNLADARKLYQFILETKERYPDPWLQVIALDGLAAVSFFEGDYHESLSYIKQASKSPAAGKYWPYALGNSARIHIKLGEFDHAIELLSLAINLTSDISKVRNLLSFAYAHGLKGDPRKGLDIIGKIEPDSLNKSRPDLVAYYEYKGHLLFLQGNSDEALEVLNEGLRLSLEEPVFDLGAGQINRKRAEVFLSQGDFENAADTAQEAHRICIKTNERYELGILYWIYARIAQHEGEAEKAEDNLIMAKRILSEIGAKYEIRRMLHR
jgi:tetratricopeptide (TPR) repeat protein